MKSSRVLFLTMLGLVLFSFACGSDPAVAVNPTPELIRLSAPQSTAEAPPPLESPTEPPLAVLPTSIDNAQNIINSDANPDSITAVSTIDLKVRSGPGTNFAQTGTLKKGTQVTLLGISPDRKWYQHDQGWSAVAYLETEADTSQLFVILVPTPTLKPTVRPISKLATARPSTAVPTTPLPPTEIAPTPIPQQIALPAQSNCDPNYTPCVPIASDVDCAGGSGNGPAYVEGPVRVIGRDIYKLDSDHDGIGCE